MSFYKVTDTTYLCFAKGDIIYQGFAHYFPVKLGSPITKTQNLHQYAKWASKIINPVGDIVLKGLEYGKIREMKQWEIRKVRYHMTWRIWVNDGSRICNLVGAQGFSFDILNDNNNLAPLPPVMCYDCMIEGNKWLPNKPPIEMTGRCICCNRVRFLHPTYYAWPLNLSGKGFGKSILMTGRNYTMNIRSMYHGKRMFKYAGYDGTLEWFKIEQNDK